MGAAIRSFLQSLGLVQPEPAIKVTKPLPSQPMRPAVNTLSENKTGSQQITPDFDLNDLRCQEEVESWLRMQKNEDFAQRMRDKIENVEKERFSERIRLLTWSYRLDENITPALSNVVKRVCSNLRLIQPIDVFIENNSIANAFCLPSRKTGRLILGLNSGLIELLTENELAFVVGHEIGHAILGHSEIPYGDDEDENFSILEVIKLRNLSRHMEISADRIGMIACQDINVAGSALFKLVAGLSSRWVKFSPDAYEKHIEQLTENIDLLDIKEQALTHPITPLRIKALKVFRESELYARAFAQTRWNISTTELEKHVEHLLALAEPQIDAPDLADNGPVISSFLLNASLLLIASDGKVTVSEKKWLQNRFNMNPKQLDSLLESETLIDNLVEATAEFGDKLTIILNANSRFQVFKALCSALFADGVLVEQEADMLRKILELLKLNENAWQQALESAQAENETLKSSKPGRKKKSSKE